MKNIFKQSGLIAATSLLLIPAAHAASFTVGSGVTDPSAKTLTGGQTGTVNATGSLTVSGSTNAVVFNGTNTSPITLINSGTISQTGTGRALRNTTDNLSISVTNNAGALIKSANADAFQMNNNSAVSMENRGTVQSLNSTAGGNQAIDWNAITSKTNTLRNYGTGQILASGADAVRPGVNGTITNDSGGLIKATPVVDTGASSPPTTVVATSSDGIDTQVNSGVTVTNTGTIEGRHGITGGNGANAYSISVTNNVGGTLTGSNGSGINIDGAGSSATIINNGTISGIWNNASFTDGDGDGVDVDGTANLTNNGIIRGLGSSTTHEAQGVTIGAGTVVNNAGAEISGNVVSGGATTSQGIRVDNSAGSGAYGSVSITNSGTIRGNQGAGIQTIGTFGNTITNNAGGTIRGAAPSGAIVTDAGNDIIINRGVIIGDNNQAIDMGAGNNTLTVEGGSASITGDVSGGVGGSNTLNLNIGTGNTFAYSGVLSNFTDVQVNGGTTTLSGASTYIGQTTINSGTLVAANTTGSATGTGTVDVKDGATLAGTGIISGPLTIETGGVLSPGVNGVGALHGGATLLNANSFLNIDLDPTNSLGNGIADALYVTGTVSLDASNLFINLLSAPTLGQAFDIIFNDGNDAITGLFNQAHYLTASYASQSYLFYIDYIFNADSGSVGNDVRLTQVASMAGVPEPGIAIMLGFGGLFLGFRRYLAKPACSYA